MLKNRLDAVAGSVNEQPAVLSAVTGRTIEVNRKVTRRIYPIPRVVFKTGGLAELPSDCSFDFICLEGIVSFNIGLVEVFQKIKQALKPGGRLLLVAGSEPDSLIYYGMESGFDFLKTEIIETGSVQYLIENGLAGDFSMFFTLLDLKSCAECRPKPFWENHQGNNGVWFLKIGNLPGDSNAGLSGDVGKFFTTREKFKVLKHNAGF